MTETRLREILADPVLKELTASKVKFLMENPFLGQIITRMEFVEAPWSRSAATDGLRMYWNREFFKTLSRNEKYFVIGHECLHIVFDHIGRRGNRDPAIYNMATDYIINSFLKRENIGSSPKRNGKEICLFDERYTSDMSSDEVYNLLIENSTTIELPLDDHLEVGDGRGKDDGEGDGQGSGRTAKMRVLGKDGPPTLTQEELEKARQEMRAAIIASAQQCAGNIPAGLRKMINNLLEPKLDWRSLLDAYIRSSVKDDYSFQNISRRSWGLGGAILPGQKYGECVEVLCAIDASGSTSADDVRICLSECYSIVSTFSDFKIDVLSFDTEVYNHKTYTPENASEMAEYEIHGDGGTEFNCVFDYLKKEGIEPERLVILTDGLPNTDWGDAHYCPTLFLITKRNQHIVAPFGQTGYLEDDISKR